MADKLATYARVRTELNAFFAKYPGLDICATMSTINSFLKYNFGEQWGFVGFYAVKDEGKVLQIGPYQGHVLATGEINTRRPIHR